MQLASPSSLSNRRASGVTGSGPHPISIPRPCVALLSFSPQYIFDFVVSSMNASSSLLSSSKTTESLLRHSSGTKPALRFLNLQRHRAYSDVRDRTLFACPLGALG